MKHLHLIETFSNEAKEMKVNTRSEWHFSIEYIHV